MSSVNVSFSKLYNSDKILSFRLKVEWEEDFFRLFIVEGKKAWFALVSAHHLQTHADQHELPLHTYTKDLQEYLSKPLPFITVSITPKGEFVLHRHVENEKFKIKYFVVKLEKLDYYEYVEELIDSLTLRCDDSSSTLNLQKMEMEELEKERVLLEAKCKEMADMKNKSDYEIYSAVALVLNEKKSRIQFLTELLEEHHNGTVPSIKSTSSTSEIPQTKVKQRIVNPKPSTSKCRISSDTESSVSDGYNTDNGENAKVKEACDNNLDFLGDESPPHSIVPKRFKSDKNVDLPKCSVNASQLSTLTTDPKPVENINETKENSQQSHFDTQDLLDMM